MPIQWYKQPDGTWILWNTDRGGEPQPIEVPPAAGVQGAPGTDTSAQARQLLEQSSQNLAANNPKGRRQFTAEDKVYSRNAIKMIQGSDASPDEKFLAVQGLMDRGLISITDSGDVYTAFQAHGSDSEKQSGLDAIRYWSDRQNDMQAAVGFDPTKQDQPTADQQAQIRQMFDAMMQATGGSNVRPAQ